MSQITVLKFGSSVLRSESDLPLAVHEIYREWRAGRRVVAVVSAFGATTDELLKRAEQLGLPPQREGLAVLLATGEAAAAALLTLALDRSGLPVTLLDPSQIGLVTQGDPLDADPIAVDAPRLARELERAVVVVPGFAGRDALGRPTLLGRGGSDLTALFLARELGGACRLLKDTDGLYSADPASGRTGRAIRRFAAARWETLLRVGGRVVQPKAVRFARDAGLEFEIAAPFPAAATRVGPGPDRLAPASPERPPLRVALLGCGTVGGGVLAHLLARPSLFQVTGVAVRDLDRVRHPAVPRRLLTDDPAGLLEREADVVVELLGGREPARGLISWALHLGRHVVTANKALLAGEVDALAERAARRGAALRFSAGVGGALPALEAVRRAAASGAVRSIAGVLNGTCNFVLDRCAAGATFAEAVTLARDAGYAEADPSLDLDGSDAAQKLSLLIREAFGETLPWEEMPRQGIGELDDQAVAEAARRGRRVRLVASCERTAEGLSARVELLELPPDHPLAKPTGAGNALAIELADGEVTTIEARGAGRWPTSEAVLADLYDLCDAAESARTVEVQPEEQEGVA